MDPEVVSKLREEFPDGEHWGWVSLLADQPVFWTNDHERLTDLSDRQILISLIWRHYFAWQWGKTPHLYFDEKKLWKRHFEAAVKAAALLIFCLFYNFCGDADHDGIADIAENLAPISCDIEERQVCPCRRVCYCSCSRIDWKAEI
jgi:hypothetical protein